MIRRGEDDEQPRRAVKRCNRVLRCRFTATREKRIDTTSVTRGMLKSKSDAGSAEHAASRWMLPRHAKSRLRRTMFCRVNSVLCCQRAAVQVRHVRRLLPHALAPAAAGSAIPAQRLPAEGLDTPEYWLASRARLVDHTGIGLSTDTAEVLCKKKEVREKKRSAFTRFPLS